MCALALAVFVTCCNAVALALALSLSVAGEQSRAAVSSKHLRSVAISIGHVDLASVECERFTLCLLLV